MKDDFYEDDFSGPLRKKTFGSSMYQGTHGSLWERTALCTSIKEKPTKNFYDKEGPLVSYGGRPSRNL